MLFGHGFGSYGLVYKGIDGRLYPHNILIEIWMECGLLAFFTLTLIMILTIYSKNIFQTRFNLIVLFITLNLLKSFNFGDIRLFFL